MTIAMEFVAVPITALNPAKIALATIPIMLVLIIILFLLVCSFIYSYPPANSLPAVTLYQYIYSLNLLSALLWNFSFVIINLS